MRAITLENGTWAEETFRIGDDQEADFKTRGPDLLGRYLKTLRTRRGFTLRDVSDGSEVSGPYVSQLENAAKGTTPSPRVLAMLADFWGVRRETFLVAAGILGLDHLPTSGATGKLPSSELKQAAVIDQAFRLVFTSPGLGGTALRSENLGWIPPETRRLWLLTALGLERLIGREGRGVRQLLREQAGDFDWDAAMDRLLLESGERET
jgi:transcriptional regulator with XRE-family HTH domain